MVRFTDKAREFWLEQSLDKGEMPKRDAMPQGICFTDCDVKYNESCGWPLVVVGTMRFDVAPEDIERLIALLKK